MAGNTPSAPAPVTQCPPPQGQDATCAEVWAQYALGDHGWISLGILPVGPGLEAIVNAAAANGFFMAVSVIYFPCGGAAPPGPGPGTDPCGNPIPVSPPPPGGGGSQPQCECFDTPNPDEIETATNCIMGMLCQIDSDIQSLGGGDTSGGGGGIGQGVEIAELVAIIAALGAIAYEISQIQGGGECPAIDLKPLTAAIDALKPADPVTCAQLTALFQELVAALPESQPIDLSHLNAMADSVKIAADRDVADRDARQAYIAAIDADIQTNLSTYGTQF